MVDLDVDPVLIGEVVAIEEAVDCGAVVVVLMLGWFLRLGFDQQLALETDRVLVFGDHGHEARQLIGFLLHTGVMQRLVTFASAPQDVVVASQLLGDVEHVADLCSGVGEHVGVRVGGGASCITRM